jgi:WD40 repeat protein
VHRLGGHAGVPLLTASDASRRIATGDDTGRIRIFALDTGETVATFTAHAEPIRAVDFSADGSLLATGGREGEVAIWNAEKRTRLRKFQGFRQSQGHCVSLAPDGNTVAYTHRDRGFRVYDVGSGALVAKLKRTSKQSITVSFSPDGSKLATTSRDSVVRLWSVTGEPLAELRCDSSPWPVTFSPSGRKLAAGTWAHEVWVWDLQARSPPAHLKGHGGAVWVVAFLPGSDRFLASGSGDGTVRLWDLKEQRCIAVIEAFEANVDDLSFGDGGRTLIVSGAGPDVLVYDLEYHARHIAGNLEYQYQRLLPKLGDSARIEELRAWAEDVMSRPWPRLHWDSD